MQILHLVQSRACAIFTRCSFQIFINPDFYSTIYLTLAAISQVWEYFHMLNIVKSATIMISCSFHTYSNFHSSQHWLDFARLPDFCLVTWQVWLSRCYMVSVGKFSRGRYYRSAAKSLHEQWTLTNPSIFESMIAEVVMRIICWLYNDEKLHRKSMQCYV